ncbi:high affinity 3',5'-cyclic-AMP phosphodiesterase 7A-like [Watersipora subatra]|uniref:high affinity 3',5'-cyclic-AMP phosphodiesterase 7A-like n=1 Tax=Watersipora subatra TaxID=2589382 RepID=UPI00355C3A11
MAKLTNHELNYGRLPIDLTVLPHFLFERRGAISFGPPSIARRCVPRLGRRAGISFDSKDKNAVYIRQLGDVRLHSQQEKVHQYILNNLLAEDKRLLQNVPSSTNKPRCGSKFLTVSGVRRRRRSVLKQGPDVVDGFYKSPTKCLLDKVSDWSFDVFCLNESSDGRPLFHMILKLFQKHNLMQEFGLDIVKLMKFARLVEEGYHDNPYHNAIHAADVAQAMHCYIMQEKIARHLTPLETMAALIAAITHDLDHPGVNQTFLIATSNHLASLYKNCSILENHHWRTAVGILHESALLDHLTLSERKSVIEQMQSLILATDMSRQQEFCDKLCKRVAEGDIDMSEADDKHFILQIALKCADISNPARSWKTCYKWSRRVCDEFYEQGDYERRLGLDVTMLCNRYSDKVPIIQQKFIYHVVEPLFTEFGKFLPGDLMTNQVNNIKSNMEVWKRLPESELLSLEGDINSNFDTIASPYDDISSGDSEDTLGQCVTTEPSESVADINKLRANILFVKERIDWSDIKLANRRPSLPLTHRASKEAYARRESFPRIQDNRTTCLPPSSLYQALSYDQLVEKLTGVGRDLTSVRKTTGHAIHLDNLISESRISTLSPNLETSKITNYFHAKQLMSK